jgi:hypothetical protein
MFMRHARKIKATDQMIHAENFHEALDVYNAVIWTSYNEAILTQRIQSNFRLVL